LYKRYHESDPRLFSADAKSTGREVRNVEPLPGARASMREMSRIEMGSDRRIGGGAMKMTFSVFARVRCE
jgi:hypothetical protein